MQQDNFEIINSLVKNAKQGDKKSLFELYAYYKPLLLSSVKRCIQKNSKLASYREDIFKESLFVLEKLIDQYDPSLTYFSYFLSTRIDINLFRYINDKYQTFDQLQEEYHKENETTFKR
jgi:DNA-directed RNA polymerase specialized sigma subunit